MWSGTGGRSRSAAARGRVRGARREGRSALARVGHAVADPALAEDVVGALRVVAELGAEVSHEDVHQVPIDWPSWYAWCDRSPVPRRPGAESARARCETE